MHDVDPAQYLREAVRAADRGETLLPWNLIAAKHNVEGTLARWFAVDAAVFTGPWAAWSSSVFDDYSTVNATSEFMALVAPTNRGDLSARWMALRHDPSAPSEEASRGVYSFDADPGYGGQAVYFLDASPL